MSCPTDGRCRCEMEEEEGGKIFAQPEELRIPSLEESGSGAVLDLQTLVSFSVSGFCRQDGRRDVFSV